MLPARIRELANFIGGFRKSIHLRIPEFALRRRFWERIVDGPIGALVMAGRKEEAERALREIADPAGFAGANDQGAAEGAVTLVGAGPGDPDLLTVKALRALQDADVIFYDELVCPRFSSAPAATPPLFRSAAVSASPGSARKRSIHC